ncbi:Pol protein, partial [Phytophthora palmivora]
MPDGTDQAGSIGPHVAEAAEGSAEGVSCVGNIGPQVGNIGPQLAEVAEEDAESASGVGNIVPRRVEETEKNESAACVSSVGSEGPRGVKKPMDNQVPHWESETPPARPVEEQCHVFDGLSGRQVKAGAVHLEELPEVSALLNLEELSMKDFLVGLKAGEIAEMVLLNPETSPEDLKPSSVMDEDVLEGFTKQRATRLGSEILKNPEDPVCPLVKEHFDVASKHPPSQLPPDRGVRHEIDLVPGTKYCVTRQWPLPREQCEVIDASSPRRRSRIKVLGCFVSRVGVRADPGKVNAIAAWPTPRSQTDLRKWLGLANYLHKYSAGYAKLAQPLSDLLKKDAGWVWEQQHQDAFDSIKASLQQAPVLALPDENQSFSVVCDASDYAIGCALLQKDDEGHELHLLGPRPFVIYTDHASFRTATNSPHLSQRMARWLSFFAEYNFRVEYKPGKLNVLADALSRRPDYELAH